MNAEDPVGHEPEPQAVSDAVVLAPASEPPMLAPHLSHDVSDQEFEQVVRGALEAVDGTFLFKMKIGSDREAQHAAAAVVGLGKSRQFLLLTLPVAGGQLKVETASHSENPLARIAESYAGLLDVLKAAA
jgi:hypothetical protein